MTRVLLVAERANQMWSKARCAASPKRWYPVALRIGAFRNSPLSVSRLSSIGIDLDSIDSLNLCPPGPTLDSWDRAFAMAVADIVRHKKYDRILLCGRRVQYSFAIYGASPGQMVDNRYICVPHPSGLNHFWNDPFDVAECAQMVSRALQEDLSQRCRLCNAPCDARGADDCSGCELTVCPKCKAAHGKNHLRTILS